LRYILRITLVFLSALAFVTPASAESTIRVTQPTDFWFDYSEPTLFVAITYQSDTFPSDPQLWLYTEDGVLLITNDDFIGLQSRIEIEVPAGRYRLRASTCCYEPDVWRGGGEWNIQYELYYNGLQTDPTTTTEVTTSLPPEVSSTTTQPELPTTTLLPGEPPSTTSSTTSTIPETTTTWELPTTSTILPTTTTTTVPTTTVPVTEAPTTSTLVLETPQTSLVPTTSLSPFFPTPLTTTSPPTTTATTTIPPTSQPTEIASEPPQTAPDSPETTTTTLPPIVEGEAVEPEIAVAYATDPQVLATVTADEATEIFDAIIVDELTPEQAAEIVAAVQDAPPEVREAFEEEINVFDGTFDTYVPLGSNVSVSTRRTVTAATAALGATIPVANRKQTK
jgi:hypothetical protein